MDEERNGGDGKDKKYVELNGSMIIMFCFLQLRERGISINQSIKTV